MNLRFIKFACFFGATGVAIGAFGAHSLKDMLEATGRFNTFETAVRYQFYHTFLLLIIGLIFDKFNNKQLYWAGYLVIIGIFIFSGSLYILCFTGITWLGAITPLGGLLFIASWVLLGFSLRNKITNNLFG